MTGKLKLHLAGYCIGRLENLGYELSNEQIMYIINFVVNDKSLNDVLGENYNLKFMTVYFCMNHIQYSNFIQENFVESN